MIKVSGTGVCVCVVRGVTDALLLISALELILFFTRQFEFSLRQNILSKWKKIKLSSLTNPPLLLKFGLFSAELLHPTGGFSPRCSNLSWAAFRVESAGTEVRSRAGKTLILSYYLDPGISFTTFSRKEIPEIALSLKTIKSEPVLPSWVLFILLLELLCMLWECVVVWFWHSSCSSLKPGWYFISWKKAEDIPGVTFSCKVANHLSVIHIKSGCVLNYLRLLIVFCPLRDILTFMKKFRLPGFWVFWDCPSVSRWQPKAGEKEVSLSFDRGDGGAAIHRQQQEYTILTGICCKAEFNPFLEDFTSNSLDFTRVATLNSGAKAEWEPNQC